MPGIHFYYDSEGGADRRESLLASSARALLHEDWFKQKTLSCGPSHFLGYTYHPSYPVAVFENDLYYICLEGRIYGKSDAGIDSSLSDLAEILFAPGGPGLDKASSWLMAQDGDFTIFMLEKGSGRIRIINDALGRLPIHIVSSGGRTVLSRELRFITRLLGEMRFDRTAMALYLLLGFIPGTSSFIEGVTRLEPATLVTIDPPGESAVFRLRAFDFESMIKEGGEPLDRAAELADIFTKAAAERRSEGGVNVLALSGGLDSRSTGAALSNSKIPFYCATFLDHYETAAADVDTARDLSYLLGSQWRLFPLGLATGGEALRLLREKNGMNSLGMSFSIPLFDAIRAEWGSSITYFTGEGGGLTVPDTRPFRKIADLDDLTGFVMERNAIMPPETAASIAGISPSLLRGGLREILREYPERSMDMRYVHFIVCERNQRWTAEGEDRNRFFFWTVSPFNSLPFFESVMSCPPPMKSRHRLYRDFLTRLSPEAAAVVNANWNLPITGKSRFFYLYAREIYYRMPAALRKLIRKKMKSSSDVIAAYDEGSPAAQCLSSQLAPGGAAGDYLSAPAVERSLPHMSKLGFDHLFTLSSLIEDLGSGRSTIESYLDTPLI